MTAQTFTANVRPASTFSPDKHNGGNYLLTSTALTAIAALDASSTVADVLNILSTVTKDQHTVGPSSIGFATSVQS